MSNRLNRRVWEDDKGGAAIEVSGSCRRSSLSLLPPFSSAWSAGPQSRPPMLPGMLRELRLSTRTRPQPRRILSLGVFTSSRCRSVVVTAAG